MTDPWLLGILLKPFMALFIFGGIALPIRWLINRFMPECWLKHQLLLHRGGPRDRLCR